MATKKSTLDLTPEEEAAILALRERKAKGDETNFLTQTDGGTSVESPKYSTNELANALIHAIESTRPPSRKTIDNRRKLNPWTPKDGSKKITELSRKFYHHGVELNPKRLKNETCRLLEQIKPGKYGGGYFQVKKRKDGGLDIQYPIRTVSQKLKVQSQFGIRNFDDMLKLFIDERAANPHKYITEDDE